MSELQALLAKRRATIDQHEAAAAETTEVTELLGKDKNEGSVKGKKNEEGEDMFGILEEQYNRMTGTSVRLAIFGVVFVYVFVYLSPIHANPLLPPPPPQGKCTKSWWKRKKGHTASLCPLSKA